MARYDTLEVQKMDNERKKRYKDQYNAAKKAGEPFFPFTIFKDGIVVFLIFVGLMLWSVFNILPLEAVADPTDTSYNPRPEWYFLFLFEMLKYFPGKLEPVATAIIPGVAVLALLLLPFIDRSSRRLPQHRPIVTGIGLLGIAGIVLLTVLGAKAPLVSQPVEESPLVIEGKKLYDQFNCQYCHTIKGKGGTIGPDLTTVADRRGDPEWLRKLLKDPQSIDKHTEMPNFNLTAPEVEGLVAYLLTLEGPGTFSAEAPQLFKQNCAACHKIGTEGGEVGPDLTKEGSFRDFKYIEQFITSPKAVLRDAKMPGFGGVLSPEQIADVAKYLANQTGEGQPAAAPAGTPTPAPTITPKTGPISFKQDIMPLFQAKCVACHGSMGGFDLSSYKSTMSSGDHRPVVKPGDPDGSLLIKRLKGEGGPMPPGTPLSPDVIAQVASWITAGAQDN